MKFQTSSLLTLLLFSSHTWGYEKGWDYQNFYAEVDWCKKSVIFPAAQNYIKAGIESEKSVESMRAETISMVPVFESMATDMCYCTFNELAKDLSYTDYERGEVIKDYMNIPRCQSALKKAMEEAKNNPGNWRLQ